MYCVGTSSERRFFYSSSQQLRNSFSHVPIHLAECSHVPAEIKARMEELKATKKDEAKKLKQVGRVLCCPPIMYFPIPCRLLDN